MACYQVKVMLDSDDSPKMYRSGGKAPEMDSDFFMKAVSFVICLSFMDDEKKGCYPLMVCRVGEMGFPAMKDVPDMSFREQDNFRDFLKLICSTFQGNKAFPELSRNIQHIINSKMMKAERKPHQRLMYII